MALYPKNANNLPFSKYCNEEVCAYTANQKKKEEKKIIVVHGILNKIVVLKRPEPAHVGALKGGWVDQKHAF